MVYDFTLNAPGPTFPAQPAFVPLLCASKQIYREAIPVLYSSRLIHARLDGWLFSNIALDSRDSYAVRHIRKVYIDTADRYCVPPWETIAQVTAFVRYCPQLRTMEIEDHDVCSCRISNHILHGVLKNSKYWPRSHITLIMRSTGGLRNVHSPSQHLRKTTSREFDEADLPKSESLRELILRLYVPASCLPSIRAFRCYGGYFFETQIIADVDGGWREVHLVWTKIDDENRDRQRTDV